MKFHFPSRKKRETFSSDNSLQGTLGPETINHADVASLAGSDQISAPISGPVPQQTAGNAEDSVESRAELVARLRQEIRDGTYEIPVTQLVKALTALLLRRR